jgi:FixJ family two-component response regulator
MQSTNRTVTPMNEQRAVVAVIDDDESVREALQGLLESVALKVELFGSVDDYLRTSKSHAPNCIVLDLRLPGPSGLDLQAQLAGANSPTPIVFITAHGDIRTSVRAMKAGAIEFLAKPLQEQELLDAVRNGIERDRVQRAEEQAIAELRTRFASLTPREKEVMALLAAGRLNKQIAGQMGTSEMTARVHRNQVMHKMGAQSLADLVRIADRLDGPPTKQSLI